MPTRPTKGDHGTADAGSKGRGGQKATYGSAVSEDVAQGRREVDGELDAEQSAEQLDVEQLGGPEQPEQPGQRDSGEWSGAARGGSGDA